MTPRGAARSEPALPLRSRSASSPPAMLETLAMGYVLMLAAGFFLFRQPWVMVRGNELSNDRAAFITINTATLTGFQYSRTANEYTAKGQLVVLLLTVGGTVFTLLAGGWAVARIARLPYSDRQIAGATAILLALAAGLGLAGLWGPDAAAFAAMFNGISALGNSGIHLGKLPASAFWSVHVILLPLALLGGFGVPLLMEIFAAVFHRHSLSTHARITLAMTCGVYLLGTILLFALQFPWTLLSRSAMVTHEFWQLVGHAYADSSAAAINSRSAGFAFTSIGGLSRIGQWIIMGLMIVGAGAGAAAGGIKVTTLFVLERGARASLSGKPVQRIFGIAMVWLGAYFTIVLVTLVPLLATQPEMPPDRLLFLAISAASNAGLSHDPVSITGPGLIVLSVGMLLGRIIPLLVLWWTVSSARDAEIAIG